MPLPRNVNDTIAAQATAAGRGGIGIIRISGPQTQTIALQILGRLPKPRYATAAKFLDVDASIIDEGLAIYFPAPHSFTGEAVLELQGHGGPVVMDRLLTRLLQLGARLARPGEFSERAFLNNKMDLTQVEAVADLIDATSVQAAKSAIRSLQGEFSKKIQNWVETLIRLRMMVEAAIDFPEEEIDFLAESTIQADVVQLIGQINEIEKTAKQSVLLKEGIAVVIIGSPNVGKSSLLNQLSGYEAAIVSDIPGTTRDMVRESIHLSGIPVHVIDTAGLRESDDVVEQEGIRRAKKQIENADVVLLMQDITSPIKLENEFKQIPCVIIKNKIDLLSERASKTEQENSVEIKLSAKTGEGIELLREHLKTLVGIQQNDQGTFLARRRHLEALRKAQNYLNHGLEQLIDHRAGELLAEDLRQAQQALSEITGEFTADDLLGKIFAEFCIGK